MKKIKTVVLFVPRMMAMAIVTMAMVCAVAMFYVILKLRKD